MDLLRQWYANYDADLVRIRRFWAGQEQHMVSVFSTQHSYRQCFSDETILSEAPRHLQAQAVLPGGNLPSFFPDWGTISTAKYWSGTARFDSTGGNIFIDPAAQTLDDALALRPRPVDDPKMDAAHALRLFHRLEQELYTNALWLRSPDMQGPLNTAGLIVNQEQLMMAMHTDKAKARAFLEKVTDFIIAYAQYLRRESGERLCGNIWPYTFLPSDLGFSFTEDLMPLVSARTYREFGLPILRRLSETMGGLHIHCCGTWGRHARSLAEADLPLLALEFHHPETTIEELEPLAGQVVLVPYVLLHKTDQFQSTVQYYRYLLDHYGQRHRFWFACTEETEEMVAFAKEFDL
jgi:hypothetical protein